MQEVRYEQVVSSLESLEIQNGDGLLVHSAMQYLGRPQGGLQMYLDAILTIIGKKGTIAVPAFNFGFAQGESYDPNETPSKGMGAFSEFIRLQTGALRTPHPMQSLAVMGRFAQDLVERDTASAFDPGSAFERMLQLDFKLLLLGADERAISIFHYAEQRTAVPYRYWKEFSGEYHTLSGWQNRTYRMYVRDMDLNPELSLKPIVSKMVAEGHWHSVSLNYGMITACRLQDFILAAEEILSVDPWQLVIKQNPSVQTTANHVN